MFGDKYKIDNNKINPRPSTIDSLSEKMKYNIDNNEVKFSRKNKYRYGLVAASFIFVIISVGGYFISSGNNKSGDLAKTELSLEEKKSETITGEEGNTKEDSANDSNQIGIEEDKVVFYVPKTEIKKRDDTMLASMVSMVIYNGRVYVQSGTNISKEDANLLKGKKIGVTKDLCEFMEQSDTKVGGTIDFDKVEGLVGPGEVEVYEAKGYDENFRLLIDYKDEYRDIPEIYESLNGIRIKTGNDVFGKLKIAGNIKSVKWDTFNNWNYGTHDPKNVDVDENINNFVKAMYDSIPYSLEDKEFRNQFYYKETEYYEEGQDKQKFLYIKLNDGTTIQVRLFSNGYIAYSGLYGFVFKVEEKAFNDLWNILIIPGA